MTLLEKIEAYVASQGNQVGGGSEFADLLKEIVNSIPAGNEPLIVAGETLSSTFTVTDGTSLEYLGQEFKKGRLILLHDTNDYEVVIDYIHADGALHTKNWALVIE